MAINPKIFKAYDIRGKVPKELNVDSARRIGNAVARFLSKKYKRRKLTLLVGSDVRTSSPVLKKALIEGIVTQGSSVVDVGVVTTPLFYFALGHSKNDGGVMVTASHNPSEYNGFKIRGHKLETVSEDSGLRTIQKLSGERSLVEGRTLGDISEGKGWLDRYVSHLAGKVKIGKARIVVDAGGGSTALVLPKLLSHFPGVLYKPLFFTPDGSFSVHDPNPLKPESQDFIKEELKEGSFDFGVLFDGDGDRAVFFDEFGNEVRADFILALLAGELLKKHKHAWIVLELTSSQAVEEHIRSLGGKVVRAKVGFVNMTKMMQKKKAIVGGEISGHFFFRDFGYSESSMYAFLNALEIVSKTPKKLSHLVRPLQKYFSGYQLNFEVRDKAKVIRAVVKRYGKEGKISRLDGVTIKTPEWWFNVRQSNTEPLVRLTMEAKTKDIFDAKQKELSDFIRSIR